MTQCFCIFFVWTRVICLTAKFQNHFKTLNEFVFDKQHSSIKTYIYVYQLAKVFGRVFDYHNQKHCLFFSSSWIVKCDCWVWTFSIFCDFGFTYKSSTHDIDRNISHVCN